MAIFHKEKHVGESPFESRFRWRSGAASGFLASGVTGLAITLLGMETLRVAIAGLYGFEGNIVVGWAAHLIHGALFGVVFAAVLADPGLYAVSDWLWKTVLAGAVYGIVLAVFGAGIIMPIWLGAVGAPVPATIPNVTAALVGWHLLYGLVLGGAFFFLEASPS
ncbi:histidine kinase [Haloarchaeobius sp. DYHT-AS-18]|uniref:histidine kinase n=1 Tax=Haloarchaeobius sp. DYHT-AS-18 TaxID=3446117 RepID=UPI003EB97EDD